MSQESKFKCPEGEYWDGLLRKCHSCLKVCELDNTYCCRNCPAFCEVRIPNSANNGPITTIKYELDENQNSALVLSLQTLVIIITSIIFLAAVCLAICCFIRCLAKAKRHHLSSSGTEVAKPLNANDLEEGPRERQPSDASANSRETSVKCCHFVSPEDGRKLINQGIVHSHVSDKCCFSNRYCPHQHDQLKNKICTKHQPIIQTSSCTLNHYQDDISGNIQHNSIAEEEEIFKVSGLSTLNIPVENQSEEKCQINKGEYNDQQVDWKDQSLNEIQIKHDSQVLYAEEDDGGLCYITKIPCDDIL